MTSPARPWLFSLLAMVAVCPVAIAAVPYTPVPVHGPPVTGPGVSPPADVYGKEFSHDKDISTSPIGADPQQVINWDGTGGVADGIDYSLTSELDLEVDAIANHRDALFRDLLHDDAHLVYSLDDMVTAYPGLPVAISTPPTGPVSLASGQVIGGAGEVSVELAGNSSPPSVHHLWASQPEVSRMPLPNDVDGLELWGPEPKEIQEGGVFLGDADKYSMELDSATGVSVWNASGTPYLSHGAVVAAVESLLGTIPGGAYLPYDNQEGPSAINLDALMVLDGSGQINQFDFEPHEPQSDEPIDQVGRVLEFEEPSDTIIFSIRQIIDTSDPDGYYATGSELFVLDSLAGASFLTHGGHVWDHGYALGEFRFRSPDQEDLEGVLDINAIEAIGEGQEVPIGSCPGDFNADGIVDAADYTLWRDNLGSSDESLISFNGVLDGTVDQADYSLWRTHFGHICPPTPILASATNAPEPLACVLLAFGSLIGYAGGRRRA